MKRTFWTLAGAAFVIVSAMAAGSSRLLGAAPQDKAEVAVKIDNFMFAPNAVTVPVGSMVRWTNRDDIPHNVMSDDKTTFKSKTLQPDEQFTYTFDKPGAYNYLCSIHPTMTGKIVVE